ncbi:uncharacterized protein BX663DRAFT_439384 [Cokeromyces recurvatus]|uniref:uncharacterized protein n=1 Tax=Cokeromyces recurvatus TaxID=90255 RepID=UPI0022201781|nr:uncharacterized protein BX663DRAFT_439384 [Cokeromyces recurvatus]KAI7900514.1 hypothetical protein BX663DRAFT_439384 [Cokeromyces recurvatus]
MYLYNRHYFLAQGGVNTQVLIKELGTIHLGGLEHRQPIQDTNVEGYLEQKNIETIMKIIQDERQEIVDNTNDSFKKDINAYWDNLLNNTFKVNEVEETTLNLSKAKFDQSLVANAIVGIYD